MVNLTEADKVFEGTFAGTETGWIQITLDKAFEFDGNSNLLVAFYDPTEGSFGTSNMFYYTSTSNYMVLDYYDDALCPDLSDLSSYQGTKDKPMQVTQNKEDGVLELETAIGTFIKKRIDVVRTLFSVVKTVIVIIIVFVSHFSISLRC